MSRWSLKPLGEICSTTSGGTPSRSHPEYFGGAIPWIKSGDLTDGDVIACDENITEEAIRSSSAKLFPQGTVLVAMYGATVGKLGMLGMEAATNQAVCGITPSDELDRWFLFYFLLSQRQNLIGQSAGGAQPNISQKIVRELLVPVPPLSEQRRIVDLLSRAEGIVRLRREAEKKAAELIPALFLDMFGDPAANPKGWPSAAIGDLFDVKGGKRLPKGAPYSEEPTALRYIRATDIKADRINERNLVFLFPEVQKSISRYVVAAEDVVITIAGTIGVAAPIGSSLSGVNLTENAAMIRPKNQARTNAIFFSSLMNSAFVQRQIEALTGRVTIGKLALERIRLIEIRLPPLPLQQEFGEKLAMVRSIQSQQSNATVKAKATFDALLTQAFSG